jgi:hypothetical protein
LKQYSKETSEIADQEDSCCAATLLSNLSTLRLSVEKILHYIKKNVHKLYLSTTHRQTATKGIVLETIISRELACNLVVVQPELLELTTTRKIRHLSYKGVVIQAAGPQVFAVRKCAWQWSLKLVV